jgi:hypothetical protein
MTRITNGTLMCASSRTSRHVNGEAGQALVELVLTLPVLVVLVAMAYQMFRAHQAVAETVFEVHRALLARAFDRNCAKPSSACQYSSDPASEGLDGVPARVMWDPGVLTGARIPVVNMFADAAHGRELVIVSNRRSTEVACGGFRCKRTRVGAGTYMPWIRNLQFVADLDGLDLDQMAGVSEGMANGVFDQAFDPKAARVIVQAAMQAVRRFDW